MFDWIYRSETAWRYARGFLVCVGFGIALGGVFQIVDAVEWESVIGILKGFAYVGMGGLLAWVASEVD